MTRAIALAVLLAACTPTVEHEPQWKCAADGTIILSEVPDQWQGEAQRRNIALRTLRIRREEGEPWLLEAALAKAEGCP